LFLIGILTMVVRKPRGGAPSAPDAALVEPLAASASARVESPTPPTPPQAVAEPKVARPVEPPPTPAPATAQATTPTGPLAIY
ncbi:hypothetical protein ACNI5A_31930, partial [Klebsiella pneumoniae]